VLRTTFATLIAVLCLAGKAGAEVLDAAANGFTVRHAVAVEADRFTVWAAAVEEVGQWWSSDHTVSGDAANMSITTSVPGCFCERLGEQSGLMHMTTSFVNPGVMLRLTGGLGPLGLMGVSGNMTWEFFDALDGTRVKFTYVVGGYRPGGLNAIALPVDYVIGEALARMQAYVETGDPGKAVVE